MNWKFATIINKHLVVFGALVLGLSGCSLEAQLMSSLELQKSPIKTDSNLPIVSGANQNSYTLEGECQDGVESFKILTPSEVTVLCQSGRWQVDLDLSQLPEGSQQLATDQTDSKGKPVEIAVIKDTTPPTITAFTLNQSLPYTRFLSVPYDVQGQDIHEVYLTQDGTCQTGGQWKTRLGSVMVDLPLGEGLKNVYLATRDLAGNISACRMASVTVDQTPPVVSGLSNSTVPVKVAQWTWTCADDQSDCEVRTVVSPQTTGSFTGAFSNKTSETHGSGNGVQYLHIEARDQAGNVATASYSALLDNTPPVVTLDESPTSLVMSSSSELRWKFKATDLHTQSWGLAQISFSNIAGCLHHVNEDLSNPLEATQVVTITGCTGTALGSITIKSGLVTDQAGNSSSHEITANFNVINSMPMLAANDPTPSYGKKATVFTWRVFGYTVVPNFTTLNATAASFQITGLAAATLGCTISNVETVNAATVDVSVTGCEGDGTIGLRLAGGVAVDHLGNTNPNVFNTKTVQIKNTPIVRVISDTNGYRLLDSSYVSWVPDETAGDTIVKYEVCTSLSDGNGNPLGDTPWVDVGLATEYALKDVGYVSNLNYMNFKIRATDIQGKVSAVVSSSYRNYWGALESQSSYVKGVVFDTLIDSQGRRVVAGEFNDAVKTWRKTAPIERLAADGSLDTSFQLTPVPNGGVQGIEHRSDGKIMVWGEFNKVGSQHKGRLARYHADGTEDTSFSIGTGFGRSNAIENVWTLASGNIAVLFSQAFGTTFRGMSNLKRWIILGPNGDFVTSIDPPAGITKVQSFHRYANGKILVYSSTAPKLLLRLNADLTEDPSFDLGTGFSMSSGGALKFHVLADNKVIVVGGFTSLNGHGSQRIVKIHENGSVDTSFQSGTGFGTTTGVGGITLSDVFEMGGALYVRPSSQNYSYNGINYYTNNSLFLTRLNLDGTYHSFLSPQGYSLGSDSITWAAPDGNGFLIGNEYHPIIKHGTLSHRTARIHTDGSWDDNFYLSEYTANFKMSSGRAQIKASQGKFYLVGYFDVQENLVPSRNLVRFAADGSLDESFNIGSGFDGKVLQVKETSDGKLLVVGEFQNVNGAPRPYLARLLSNGQLDPTFVAPNFAGEHMFSIKGLALFEDGRFLANREGSGVTTKVRLHQENGAYDPLLLTNLIEEIQWTNDEVSAILPMNRGAVAGVLVAVNVSGGASARLLWTPLSTGSVVEYDSIYGDPYNSGYTGRHLMKIHSLFDAGTEVQAMIQTKGSFSYYDHNGAYIHGESSDVGVTAFNKLNGSGVRGQMIFPNDGNQNGPGEAVLKAATRNSSGEMAILGNGFHGETIVYISSVLGYPRDVEFITLSQTTYVSMEENGYITVFRYQGYHWPSRDIYQTPMATLAP